MLPEPQNITGDMEKTINSYFPDEILLKIFEDLKPSDIVRLSEVCKKWYSVTQYRSIVNKTMAKANFPEVMNIYLQSSRKFNFRIQFTESFPIEKYNQFTENFFENIVELNICTNNDRVPSSIFGHKNISSFADTISSLMHLKNLRKLTVGCNFETYDKLPDNLSLSVTELVLAGPNWIYFDPLPSMENSVFFSILSITPKLEELSVEVKRKHREREIVKHLKNPELIKTLKVLKWYNCDCTLFHEIKNLNLEQFTIKSPVINIEKLETFLIDQKNLKTFDLIITESYPFFIYQVNRICSLKNLQYLNVELYFDEYSEENSDCIIENCEILNCKSVCELGRILNLNYQNLKGLWTIKHLELGFPKLGTILKFLTKKIGMESLTLNNVEVDLPDEICVLTDKLKFLTNLKLFSFKFWSNKNDTKVDNLLQSIFEHLVNLQKLELMCYYNIITDFGITGNPNGFPMSRLKYLEKFELYVNMEKITKASIEHIESMRNLREVQILKSDTTEALTNPIFIKNEYLEIYKQEKIRRLKLRALVPGWKEPLSSDEILKLWRVEKGCGVMREERKLQ